MTTNPITGVKVELTYANGTTGIFQLIVDPEDGDHCDLYGRNDINEVPSETGWAQFVMGEKSVLTLNARGTRVEQL